MVKRSLTLALLLAASPARADSTIPLSGWVDDAPPDHVLVPFEVPPGTKEIEIAHDDLSDVTILDWGLLAPSGFRGWGGGNTENIVVGELAASRSYLAGPLPAGTWYLVIGKAQLGAVPTPYQATVTLRDAATLAPQPERQPYSPAVALEVGRRWYAGDLHVHSLESGDAAPAVDAIADFARSRGLDFVEISDHNTVSQDDFLVTAQAGTEDVLLLPGIEVTTYDGHANAIGATQWVEHKIGLQGATMEMSAQAVVDQGATFSINHPVLDIGDLCIGCAWKHALDGSLVGGVEIATTGWDAAGFLFDEDAILFWDALLDQGFHVAAVGGSDDHSGGLGMGTFASPLGDPTTLVLADELSAAGLVEAIRAGRTTVKLGGPDDPMVELSVGDAVVGDTVEGAHVTVKAVVTGGAGGQVRFVRNGKSAAVFDVVSDPFVATLDLDVSPDVAEERVRAEVLQDLHPITVTSHVWLRWTAPAPVTPSGSCGCSVPTSSGLAWLALPALGLSAVLRRRSTRGRVRAEQRPSGGCAVSPE